MASTEFGAAVKMYLKARRWKQRHLCDATGLTKEYVSRLINGKMPPSADMCHRIGRGMNLNAADYQHLHRMAAREHGFAV